MSGLKKEKCVSCEKFINIGQCIKVLPSVLNVYMSFILDVFLNKLMKSNIMKSVTHQFCYDITHSKN